MNKIIMKKDILKEVIGHSLVETGILIKVYSLRLFKQKGHELTPEQFIVLNLLVEEGELYQRQLGEILFKDRANITRLIKILEKDGLITRVQGVNKRVVNKISVTPKGLEVRNKILPTILGSRNKYLKDIDKDDLQICLKVLSKIQENLKDEVKLNI